VCACVCVWRGEGGCSNRSAFIPCLHTPHAHIYTHAHFILQDPLTRIRSRTRGRAGTHDHKFISSSVSVVSSGYSTKHSPDHTVGRNAVALFIVAALSSTLLTDGST
jgi:hypothetical protein